MTTGARPEDPHHTIPGLACSTWARQQGLDPIGTAGCYRGYLLVEWPLPWPRDLGEDPALALVIQAARSAGLRFQGLVPVTNDASRVVCYRWPQGLEAGYERAELVVEPGAVVAGALAVLDEPPTQDEIVDILVCTHGRRDRCCGSLGTALFQALLANEHLCKESVRLFRTSHTGGHRFAPTAVVLPEGTAWAFCDGPTLHRIVRREGPLDDLLTRYRGCAGMTSPAVQALERAVAGELGWPLFALRRLGVDLGEGMTELVVEGPGGDETVWEATVRVGARVLSPGCGEPIALATKTEPQLVVEALRQRSR